jgi:restriction system protein
MAAAACHRSSQGTGIRAGALILESWHVENARRRDRKGEVFMSSRLFLIDAETLPDLAGMMLAVIMALKAIGGSATIQELDEKVVEMEGVTEAEQGFMMPGGGDRPRVNYYLAWARTCLKRGGVLANSARGVWSLNENAAAIAGIQDTRAIYDQVNREERERARRKRLASRKSAEGPVDQPEEMPGISLDDSDPGAGEHWRSRLLAVLGQISPGAFERLSQRLLREAGFTKVEVRGKSGDGGIDGVGVLRVNLVSFQVYFQCKKWKGSVGSKEIRDFRGAMQGRADKGLFITTGHFTSQASDEATRDGATAIDLIDGERFCELLKENRLGVRSEMIETVRIDEEWFTGL